MQDRPIAFYSHALQGKHRLLSIYKKEILALDFSYPKMVSLPLGKTICGANWSSKLEAFMD